MIAAKPLSGSPSDRPIVLVVEDEVLLRIDLADAIRDVGYEVIEAHNADAALDILETNTRVHLVCTDIRMPGKRNGLELARWIKSHRPELPIILVSGEVTARNLPAVADAAFIKPIDHAVLIRKIDALLAFRRKSSRTGA